MSEKVVKLLLSSAKGDLDNFYNAFTQAGAECVGGYCPDTDDSFDGLVLCGGSDVDTSLYGQSVNGAMESDIVRDRHELMLIETFLSAGKPIFGICRGIQILNVAFGGTLIQDLGEKLCPFHSGTAENVLRHPICAEKDSFLGRLYGTMIHVNSLHHQAVDRLGDGFRAVAWSESGFVEAMEHENLPIIAVQFHPERQAYSFYQPEIVDGVPLIKYFIDTCKKN